MRTLERLRPLALLLLRCGLALVFIYHGYPKLFGNTATFVRAFGEIGIPSYFVYIFGIVETLGGLLVALGLGNPGGGFTAAHRHVRGDVEIQL
jgi:putative oxidoreductase